MINNYLKELVKVPHHSSSECLAFEEYDVCPFEHTRQIAPCVGCAHIGEHETDF